MTEKEIESLFFSFNSYKGRKTDEETQNLAMEISFQFL